MRTFAVILVALATVACGSDVPNGAQASSPEGSDAVAASDLETREERLARIADPEAARLFATVLDSIAPEEGWERTRYIEFDRISGSTRRSHRWDRFEGDYWVRGPVDDGELTALFNVNSPTEGQRVWLDGEEVVDEAQSESLVTQAHRWFINDTYWLVFPFKWDDPGVTVRYVGEREEWGETWEVVELTFEEVGLTPQNRYLAFVDPETGMFELWQYYAAADDEEPRFTNRWTDWRRFGPIVLSMQREMEDGTRGVYFEDVNASTEVPPSAFDAP